MWTRSKKDQRARFPREIIEILGYSGGRYGLTIEFVVGSLNQDDDEEMYCHLHFSDLFTFRYHSDEAYQLGFENTFANASNSKQLNKDIPDLFVMDGSEWLKEVLSKEEVATFLNSDEKYLHYRLFSYPAGVFDIISSDEPTIKVN